MLLQRFYSQKQQFRKGFVSQKPQKKSQDSRTEQNSAIPTKAKITTLAKIMELHLEENIETSKETRPWLIPSEFKPWFIPMLFGTPSTYIWLDDKTLLIGHRNRDIEIELETIESSEVTVGLFYTTLTIYCSSNESICISGISRGSANRLESLLVSCILGEELQKSLIEFKDMLKRNNYLNNRFVSDWADSHHKAFMAVKDLKLKNIDGESLVSQWINLANEWESKVNQRNTLYIFQ